MGDHITEIVIFTVLFLLVSGMGFVAARWRAPKDMAHLDEWGLGGRSFGGWITWFLIGGDLYTAYTFVAVPALAPHSSVACCVDISGLLQLMGYTVPWKYALGAACEKVWSSMNIRLP